RLPPGDLELYNVRGDLDGDGSDDLLVREADTLLVYSPLREEVVWRPITIPPSVYKALWTPLTNTRGRLPVHATVADFDGDGDADWVVGFADQVLGFDGPSGDLVFVRDARGRLTVRGIATVDPPPGDRYTGRRLIVTTDNAV